MLSVQETNQFRHLQHISLRLVAANSERLREYLDRSLMRFKGESAQLQEGVALRLDDCGDGDCKCERKKRSTCLVGEGDGICTIFSILSERKNSTSESVDKCQPAEVALSREWFRCG